MTETATIDKEAAQAAELAENWKATLIPDVSASNVPAETEPTTPEPVAPPPATTEKDQPEPVDESASDDAPAPAAKANSKPEPSAPEFDDSLIAHAAEHGLTDEEARAFGNADSLRRQLARLDRAMLRYQPQAAPPAQAQPQTPTAPPAQAAPPVVQPPPAAPATDDVDLDEEESDPKLVKAIKAHRARVSEYERQIAELKAEVQGIRPVAAQIAQERAQREEQIFDTAITALGKGFEEVLGAGPTARLSPESAPLDARRKVYATAVSLAQSISARGGVVPEPAELVRRAAYAEFGDQLHKIAKAQAVKEIDEDAKGADVLPSRRVTKATQSALDEQRQKDLANVQKVMARHGVKG